jgi:hypothetical protein
MSRTEEDNRRVLAKLPDKDGIVPLFPWWQAKWGTLGIHKWYVKLCWKVLRVEPQYFVVRPHVNATKNESKEEVWERYIKRLGLVRPDTNKPKKKEKDTSR